MDTLAFVSSVQGGRRIGNSGTRETQGEMRRQHTRSSVTCTTHGLPSHRIPLEGETRTSSDPRDPSTLRDFPYCARMISLTRIGTFATTFDSNL